MKLQQLRYAVEVFRHNLNVSEAAEALFTSQPGVSKQIRLLEDELGVQIFIRSGKRIVAVTQVGMAVLETAEQVLRGVRNIKNIGGEFAKTESGSFTLGATHDLLRFRLPSVLAGFRALFPDVRLVLKQGSPAELMGMVFNGEADLALTMDVAGDGEDLRKLSFGEWRYVLVLPRGHELADKEEISLADVAALPLLTYGFAFDGGALAARAFAVLCRFSPNAGSAGSICRDTCSDSIGAGTRFDNTSAYTAAACGHQRSPAASIKRQNRRARSERSGGR